uniref:Uncharacterized protein n=1 Tax=Myotis myotis TaxID=51298 RepID=A0A7J7QZV0_MYOMY|nr:hypothetical protein mMyoMyo1_011255 [Myotis myotis]
MSRARTLGSEVVRTCRQRPDPGLLTMPVPPASGPLPLQPLWLPRNCLPICVLSGSAELWPLTSGILRPLGGLCVPRLPLLSGSHLCASRMRSTKASGQTGTAGRMRWFHAPLPLSATLHAPWPGPRGSRNLAAQSSRQQAFKAEQSVVFHNGCQGQARWTSHCTLRFKCYFL